MQTNAFLPISTYATGTITTQPVVSFQIDTMTLGLKYVDLGASAGYMLQ